MERLCSLTLDKMAIKPRFEYDISSGRLLGSVNLPSHTGRATRGLVFMLSGITVRWKQTIAYFMTGTCTSL